MSHTQTPSPTNAHPIRIAVISFLVLVLELALIRFLPAEIKAISYFTNLLLFSAFFGLGLGCILAKRPHLPPLLPIGLLGVSGFVLLSRGIVIYDTGGEVHYWLQQADQRFRPILQMPLGLAAILGFLASALPFVTMGWALAREMQPHPRLTGYAYDLLGSFCGTVAFAALAYLGCPPWVLISLTACLWGAVFCQTLPGRLFHLLAAASFLVFLSAPHAWRWSPYYFVQYDADPNRITVYVNSSFHQEAIHFQTEDPKAAPMARGMVEKFSLPYEEYRKTHGGRAPEKVLILGAGTGNDVNIARLNGAAEITAVEIDPEIARLGRDLNPMRPYQDPKVRLIVDDGRHFLWNTRERYDLVVFGTLDSQTLLSGQANLRLDNYVYTVECFRDARQVLKPDGMLATYYSVFKEWFLGRIYATIATAFPGTLQLTLFENDYLFNTIILAATEGLPGFVSDPEIDKEYAGAIPSTDDWPYIYMEYPTISSLYLGVLAFLGVMIAAALAVLRKGEGSSRWHLDFFFLGVGFSLMESAAIVRLALAFGTTWIVNAVVFAAVLITVFLANAWIEKRPHFPLAWAWGALLVALAGNYFFPLRLLLELSFAPRIAVAAILIGIPVFFAGIAFSRLFEQESNVGLPFGMNMIGAMTGGAVEYLSMLLGMRPIWLVLLSVYFLAFLAHRWRGTQSLGGATAVPQG